MGLEDEFGLFKVKGKQVGLISGKPKRRFRRIITRPIGFFTKPVTKEIRRRTRKRIKSATTRTIDRAERFLGPTTKPIRVEMALELERTQILKRKKGKQRREILQDLGEI